MIDIHSHILPGVDDGAKTEQDSIAMAKAALQEGITKIVASPHHKNRSYDNYKTEILYQVSVLNELMEANQLPLTIIPGQEVRIYGEILEDYEKEEILSVNQSTYVLIEFPSDTVPKFTEQLFYEMQLKGLTPVIVHPERNRHLLERPGHMYELIRNGALSQVTAGSITGRFGKKIGKYALDLIQHNLAHFIASDAHNTSTRGFHLREAYHIVQEEYGTEMYYQILENSELLIENMRVNRMEPMKISQRRSKLFGLF